MSFTARGGDGGGAPPLAVSPDGYVRLTPASFRTIALVHLLSELDPDPIAPPVGPVGASAASILGFTEWASQTAPALSLGWNWRLETAGACPRYERDGEVRSNIMLIDRHRRDFGPLGTGVLLCAAVDALDWARVTADYISKRYACHLSNLTVTQNTPSL